MENGRTAGGKRALEGRGELLRALHSLAVTAESLGQNREIRVLEPGGETRPGNSRSWCMRIVPYMPLSSTITMTGQSYCTAVASSWPFIMKSPSPAKATAIRSGSCRFAMTAAGTP